MPSPLKILALSAAGTPMPNNRLTSISSKRTIKPRNPRTMASNQVYNPAGFVRRSNFYRSYNSASSRGRTARFFSSLRALPFLAPKAPNSRTYCVIVSVLLLVLSLKTPSGRLLLI